MPATITNIVADRPVTVITKLTSSPGAATRPVARRPQDGCRVARRRQDARCHATGGPGGLVSRLVLPHCPLRGVGAENPVTSCDLQVFVDESVEAVASEVANVRVIGSRSGSSCRWLLIEGSVRPVAVVVRGVLAPDVGEVAWSGDEDAVEAFAAQGADPAFGDLVGSRRPGRTRTSARCAGLGARSGARPSLRVASRRVRGCRRRGGGIPAQPAWSGKSRPPAHCASISARRRPSSPTTHIPSGA
jgi:hypothetical protein